MSSSSPSSRVTAALHTPPDGSAIQVIGIGASAGGLDACRTLLDAMPSGGGNAFILVQHLDPVHESMLVELLSGHTAMTVRQAQNNQLLEPDHLYVIPPGRYIAVQNGAIRLMNAHAREGIRMPFDFLLHSLAAEYGARSTAVVLSGAGTDGSIGIRFVHDSGGTVYVQEPSEAGYDGMPLSAIETGLAHHVMPVRTIAGALLSRAGGAQPDENGSAPHAQILEPVGRILDEVSKRR